MDNVCADCGDPIGRRGTRCKSCAAKRRWEDPKYREHHAQAVQNPKYRCKMSVAIKIAHVRGDYEYGVEWKRRHLEAMRIVCQNPIWKRNHSEAVKLAWATGAYDGISAAMKAHWAAHPEYRRKQSEALKSAHARGVYDGEVQVKRSKNMKIAWANGVYDNTNFGYNPSKLELSVLHEFELLGVICISQYKPADCRFTFDIYLPEFSTVIEVDGAYWHGLPGAAERDADKDEWAVTHGYDIVRFGEFEIKEFGPCDVVVQACTEFGWI